MLVNKQLLVVLLIGTLVSCHEGEKVRSAAFSGDDDEIVEESLVDVSDETDVKKSPIEVRVMLETESSDALKSLEEGLLDVNSPDKLLEYGDEYEREISRLESSISQAKESKTKLELESRLSDVTDEYESKVRSYSMPANGIIENINTLTKRLESCKSKSEFEKIQSPRHSYFQNLLNLYKLVEEENRRSEVRELSEKLLGLYERKKSDFGM